MKEIFQAFSYMFKDNKILQKYLIISAILAAPILFIILVKIPALQLTVAFLMIFLLIMLSGYWVTCIKAVLNQNENVVLPYINVKNNLVLGFKYAVAGLLLVIALVPIVIISGLLSKAVPVQF